MTSTGFPTLTTRTSYWQVSRAPRYSLLFAIPLLVFYQVLALLLAHGEHSIRNGADVILQALFTAAAGAWGPPLFMVCLIGGGLWLVTRDMRAHGSRLRGGLFAAMLGESIALALLVGALAAAARGLLGWRPLTAGIAATLAGAAIFSAFHYIGPYGDRWQLYSFAFRMVAGLFFSALYLVRGFGITAWTHALYDVLLLLMQ